LEKNDVRELPVRLNALHAVSGRPTPKSSRTEDNISAEEEVMR